MKLFELSEKLPSDRLNLPFRFPPLPCTHKPYNIHTDTSLFFQDGVDWPKNQISIHISN